METNVYFLRMKKAKEAMAKAGIDLFLVSPSSNLFYLSGCALKGDERLLLLALPMEGEPFVIANVLYREQVKSLPLKSFPLNSPLNSPPVESPPEENFVYWKDGEDPFGLLSGEIKKRNIKNKRTALEPHIPAFFSLPLSRTFPDTEFVLGDTITGPLRQFKDKSELELIRKACKESDRALAALMDKGAFWIGKTEAEFAQALSAEFCKGGLSSFGATIAVGQGAALPHYGVGNAVIEKGKCLLTDFWASLEGYYTDCTRTFHFGKPEKEFEKIHAIVLEAQEAAQQKARPGSTLGDVDDAARSLIEKHGYGEYFTHRTGHGIGIDIHEGPSANKGVAVPLESGMVFSIEPGIYLPGRFGVRIENLVAITEKGAEILHAYPRELKVVSF